MAIIGRGKSMRWGTVDPVLAGVEWSLRDLTREEAETMAYFTRRIARVPSLHAGWHVALLHAIAERIALLDAQGMGEYSRDLARDWLADPASIASLEEQLLEPAEAWFIQLAKSAQLTQAWADNVLNQLRNSARRTGPAFGGGGNVSELAEAWAQKDAAWSRAAEAHASVTAFACQVAARSCAAGRVENVIPAANLGVAAGICAIRAGFIVDVGIAALASGMEHACLARAGFTVLDTMLTRLEQAMGECAVPERERSVPPS